MRVTVFAGSAAGQPSHRAAVARFARELAAAGVGLVYGGGRVGLMGVLADAGLAAGGQVVGVMPQHLVDGEIAHTGLTRLEVVASMHERKARMEELADAFVAVPGGAGTLEELFEAFTWGQIGLHAKTGRVVRRRRLLHPAAGSARRDDQGRIPNPTYLNALGVVTDAAALLAFVARYVPPPSKWPVPATGLRASGSPVSGAQPQLGLVAHQSVELTSVGWVHVIDGRLLAVRTRGRDRFYLPGGKPEPGETHEDALAREVLEELGLRLSGVRPAFTVQAPAHGVGQDTELTMHCFHAEAVGEPRPAAEIDELAWMSLQDTDRAAPALRTVIERLAAARALLP